MNSASARRSSPAPYDDTRVARQGPGGQLNTLARRGLTHRGPAPGGGREQGPMLDRSSAPVATEQPPRLGMVLLKADLQSLSAEPVWRAEGRSIGRNAEQVPRFPVALDLVGVEVALGGVAMRLSLAG
jgi:hypothetical protein